MPLELCDVPEEVLEAVIRASVDGTLVEREARFVRLLCVCKTINRVAMRCLIAHTKEGHPRLNARQRAAYLCAVVFRSNLLLEGGGGTGKTYVSNLIADALAQRHLNVLRVAPTGIAARVCHGSTLHAAFCIRTRKRAVGAPRILKRDQVPVGDEHEVVVDDEHGVATQVIHLNEKMRTKLRSIQVLVLDETSMVSGGLLDLVSSAFQEATGNPVPFGGCQIVMVGDLCQLGPVFKKNEFLPHLMPFESKAWQEASVRRLELTEIMRQGNADDAFKAILRSMRYAEHTIDQILFLLKNGRHARVLEGPGAFCLPAGDVSLDRTNESVRTRNAIALAKVPAPPRVYESHVYWKEVPPPPVRGQPPPEVRYVDAPPDAAHYMCPSPGVHHLVLRTGCRAMCVRNVYKPRSFDQEPEITVANGELGTVERLTDGSVWLRVDALDDQQDARHVIVERSPFYRAHRTRRLRACFKQFAMAPGYCFTVFKSQGRTFTVPTDLFPLYPLPGLMYTAISRVTSLSLLRFVDDAGRCIYTKLKAEYPDEQTFQRKLLAAAWKIHRTIVADARVVALRNAARAEPEPWWFAQCT